MIVPRWKDPLSLPQVLANRYTPVYFFPYVVRLGRSDTPSPRGRTQSLETSRRATANRGPIESSRTPSEASNFTFIMAPLSFLHNPSP